MFDFLIDLIDLGLDSLSLKWKLAGIFVIVIVMVALVIVGARSGA